MKIAEILEFLDSISPFELQEKWDNSGLNIGSLDKEVSEVTISLDIDKNLIKNAKEGSLFIVHHPLIFSGLKRLDFSKYPSNLIKELIKKDISLIAMHTNFDKTHLNRYVFTNVLGFEIKKENDFILEADINLTKEELFALLKEKLNLNTLKVINPKDKIDSVALTTGAGASLIDNIKSDCFLTGDIKYHDAIKAINENIMMVDIRHFESEKFFVNALENSLKTLPISVIIAQSQNPFEIFTL